MSRIIPLFVLIGGLIGCAHDFAPLSRPVAQPQRPLPPPYGAVPPTEDANTGDVSATKASEKASLTKSVAPVAASTAVSSLPAKPIANHSPLSFTVADTSSLPVAPEPALIPPRPAWPATHQTPPPLVEPNHSDSAVASALPWRPRRPRAQAAQPLTPPPPSSPAAPIPPSPPRSSETPSVPTMAPPAAPPAATPATTTNHNLKPIKDLLAIAAATWKATTTYETTLTRREITPQGQSNSEVVLLQVRREPLSVYSRNVGETGHGREVVYNPSQHGEKLHIKLGTGDNKLLKAGTVLQLSPDDPKITQKMRYSLRDAGFGRMIQALETVVARVEAGQWPAEVLSYQGEVTRNEYPHPLVGVTHHLRPGDDPLLPQGGTRQYFFNRKANSAGYGLPVLVIATDAKGREVEYYLFENIRSPANLTEMAFDPARLRPK